MRAAERARSMSTSTDPADPADPATREAVARLLATRGLIAPDTTPTLEPLPSGPTAAYWRVDAPDRALCVKRPRSRPARTAGRAVPAGRAANEADYLRAARAVLGDRVPEVLACDAGVELLVTPLYPAGEWRPWVDALLEGHKDASLTQALARALARVHDAADPERSPAGLRQSWPVFHALRIAPELDAAAQAHPDLADALDARVRELREAPTALVHGDARPDNVLIGTAERWALIDAQAAWRGDAAVDVADMFTALLLCAAARPERGGAFITLAETFLDAYVDARRSGDAALIARVARLAPALFLGRVDGAAPIALGAHMRARARSFARTQLRVAPDDPMRLTTRWSRMAGDIDA